MTLLAPDPGDEQEPADSVHLRLTLRPPLKAEFHKIDLWYDRKTTLPVQVVMHGRAQSRSTVRLKQHVLNQPLDEKAMDLDPPREPGWDVSETRLPTEPRP